MDGTALEFACDATRALSIAARDLANTASNAAESPKLIDIATRLFSIAEVLDRPTPGQSSPPSKHVLKVLRDLEKVCAVGPTEPIFLCQDALVIQKVIFQNSINSAKVK
ncbi:unnamed protein product [Cercospora beticola]|nr:unnamed protein product [Cercospora beticola]